MTKRTVIIGVGGPVGSGKTLLLERLTRRMSDLNLAVITNDIYTKEDALFLAKNSSLDEDRIRSLVPSARKRCCPARRRRSKRCKNSKLPAKP